MLEEIRVSREKLDELTSRIQELYLSDHIPWIVGYSGGKDSTATLQLVWNAIAALPTSQRNHKPIHVISTDTLVEQPIVAAWVNRSLKSMVIRARESNLPFEVHRLTPELNDSYWVNLIGRGYPAPRQGFRWCTKRLKIDPANRFITEMVKRYGETILVLGTRKAESSTRAATMNKYQQQRHRKWLSPNGSLLNSWVFTPIEDWSNEDVWMYLMQVPNPWGMSNKELMAMYREATADNECPLVLDTTTPSCGNSRFGCWVCTLVSYDKSMQAMIQNDDEKVWMTPLLEFRNEIGRLNEHGRIDDHQYRDFRRMNGSIKLYDSDDRPIPGPYTKERREYLLRRLLEVQCEVNKLKPKEMEPIELITHDELREIRRIWVEEKNEFDDAVPRIYEEVLHEKWFDASRMSNFGFEEWQILNDVVEGDSLLIDLCSSLIMLEERQALHGRRGTLTEIENHIRRCYYTDEDDAATFKKRQASLKSLSLEQVGLLTAEDGSFLI
ncbi:MAG: DNA phosphorothioation system sulfurtransferase DndC [Alicyclobacillus macrosporangiidus]|uniref:DNA phosphorothioation system sulfurtransferase DndC n=1 Tax=Alicyclobacillus macrosporangiidus TaxID=392015 RepID=UPI0026EEB457|nr:DNA phosphorothioation system sulfurtransferase DndC [Alicyclobacillus macrosporangiidus]MCL6597499.1 DNA phosphorothioation system sulfurtransferase DndC [Alicyclobacillus macrosporangiidus]